MAFQALEDVDIHNYAVVDKTFTQNHQASNIFRHIYFFPKWQTIKKGEVVRLWTGSHSKGNQTSGEGGTTFHNFYWSSAERIWNNDGDEATIIKLSVELKIVMPKV